MLRQLGRPDGQCKAHQQPRAVLQRHRLHDQRPFADHKTRDARGHARRFHGPQSHVRVAWSDSFFAYPRTTAAAAARHDPLWKMRNPRRPEAPNDRHQTPARGTFALPATVRPCVGRGTGYAVTWPRDAGVACRLCQTGAYRSSSDVPKIGHHQTGQPRPNK